MIKFNTSDFKIVLFFYFKNKILKKCENYQFNFINDIIIKKKIRIEIGEIYGME